ncbi:MAG: hypothetical protein IAG10_33795 [Planctomycetaceae bacterium]|nr:hypothetical protein [Planctomycetaceae bacterium]
MNWSSDSVRYWPKSNQSGQILGSGVIENTVHPSNAEFSFGLDYRDVESVEDYLISRSSAQTDRLSERQVLFGEEDDIAPCDNVITYERLEMIGVSSLSDTVTGAAIQFSLRPVRLLPTVLLIEPGLGDDVVVINESAVAKFWAVGYPLQPFGDIIEVNCGAGDDVVTSACSPIGIYASGEAGNDTLNGGPGDDSLFGNNGDDWLLGGEGGRDGLDGGIGDDFVMGGDGIDAVIGGEGNDTLDGGGGNDWLRADTGHDCVEGGDGTDQLVEQFGQFSD